MLVRVGKGLLLFFLPLIIIFTVFRFSIGLNPLSIKGVFLSISQEFNDTKTEITGFINAIEKLSNTIKEFDEKTFNSSDSSGLSGGGGNFGDFAGGGHGGGGGSFGGDYDSPPEHADFWEQLIQPIVNFFELIVIFCEICYQGIRVLVYFVIDFGGVLRILLEILFSPSIYTPDFYYPTT